MFKIILTIGSKIKDGLGNEYILDSVIGSGGFATVYESHRLNDNEVFAVKTFSPNLNDRAQKLSFQKEIEQSNKISSENVIKYFYCHNGETFAELPPYIIMEFANQGTLADLIYNQKISGTQFDNSVIIDFFKQLSYGMLEVSKYFVHRDIKPENILIKDDKLKVSDFGLSKIVTERTQSLTMKGYGTALYAPPEAWLGKENTLQMDIYSMGIVFYNIATLNYPYNITNFKDDNEIKQAHLYNGVKNPRIYNPDLPEELAAIIIKMLEKSLNDRFKNWDEILKHIDKSNSNDNGINKFVSKALEKRNVKDLEIANKKAEESKTRHEKLMHGEMIYSQYKNKLVPLITDFINNFNQAYPETSCQGLFNQIHKKATKKCQKHFHAPDTQAGGVTFPRQGFFHKRSGIPATVQGRAASAALSRPIPEGRRSVRCGRCRSSATHPSTLRKAVSGQAARRYRRLHSPQYTASLRRFSAADSPACQTRTIPDTGFPGCSRQTPRKPSQSLSFPFLRTAFSCPPWLKVLVCTIISLTQGGWLYQPVTSAVSRF